MWRIRVYSIQENRIGYPVQHDIIVFAHIHAIRRSGFLFASQMQDFLKKYKRSIYERAWHAAVISNRSDK